MKCCALTTAAFGLLSLAPSMCHAGGGCHSRHVHVPSHHPAVHVVYPYRPIHVASGTMVTPVSRLPASAPPATAVRQPLPKPTASAAQPDAALVGRLIADAKAAFASNHSDLALHKIDQVLLQVPRSGDALQFRSLIHLHRQDWKQAARDAYEAVKLGPLWKRDTMHSLYADADGYRQDVAALQQAAAEPGASLPEWFLAAYHHLAAHDLAAAKPHLRQALASVPSDPVVQAMLTLVDRQPPGTSELAATGR